MFAFIRRLWAAAPVATIILALAIAASGFFAVRTGVWYVYWHDPAHREVQIEPWMTPGFVAHSWNVPREVVLDAIDAPSAPRHPMNFDRLAELAGTTPQALIEKVSAAIADYRAHDPHGPGGMAPPPPRPAEVGQ